MSSPLVDASAREAIASELDVTLFVEAGAGSGKTTALVSRIVSLVASGRAPVTSVAAITFTEAAAAELRLRVRRGLEERAVDPEAPAAERENCLAALGRIDEAPISTIHGFCRRILASHPIEAGLPPRFEVFDEVSQSLEWQRRWSEELDLLAGDEAAAELFSLAWLLGVTDRRIEALARTLDYDWHRWEPAVPQFARALENLEALAREATEALEKALARAAGERASCRAGEDKLLALLEELAELGGRLAGEPWRAALEVALFSRVPAVGRLGQQANWSGDIEEVRALVEAAREVQERLVQSLLDELVSTFAGYFQSRAHAAARERRRRGVLTFHDLLVLARRLLASSPSVLRDVRRRFRYVLIDEFQDTDRLQLEIARLIAGESAWEPGRCFFVGDPKQSIYRFRGADLAAYEAARREIVDEGAVLLTSNFRSVPGILGFVNGTFQSLLGEGFQLLHGVRPELGELGAVHVVGGPIQGKPLRTAQRRLEAEDCCRVIEQAVFEEGWLVQSGDGLRAARLGDVAILLPRRTGLGELEAALDLHRIGYRVESASLIFKSQEVRDLLHLARAIAEPGNQAALVATLRSPAYSIGDDELVAWAGRGGRWSTEEPSPAEARQAAPLVAAALDEIASWRSRLGELGPVGTLSLAIRERRLYQLAGDRPHVRESWRRIRYLLDRARAFVEAGGGGLGELADWVDDQLQEGLRSTESLVPEADEDVVRIMTVHGAKGLEFPITILCGFGTSDESTNTSPLVLRHLDGRAEVHFTNELETSGYGALRASEAVLASEEAVRLCYVAATRARDHLVVCGHHVPGSSETLAERLLAAAGEHRALWRRLPSVLEGGDGAPSDSPRTSPPGAAEAIAAEVGSLAGYEAWKLERRLTLARASRQANVRATELAALAGTGPAPLLEEEEDLSAGEDREGLVPPGGRPARRGRAGTRIGRAVHATLQSLSLADAGSLTGGAEVPEAAERLSEIAYAQARAERVDERGAEVARLARAALSSPVVRAAFSSGSARRELYLAAPLGGTVLDGYVDLCFSEEDGSFTVVDYKTDSVRSPSEAAVRAAGYELQAAAYALALGAVTGRPVGRCVLVFLAPPGEPIEHELSGAALEEKLAAVRALVGALG